MLVRHATLAHHLPSIRRRGLLPHKSRGRRAAVWLHTPGRSAWAALHTIRRHHGQIEDVVVLEMDLPRAWLRRAAYRGLWYTTRPIPADRLRLVATFAELSDSPRPGE